MPAAYAGAGLLPPPARRVTPEAARLATMLELLRGDLRCRRSRYLRGLGGEAVESWRGEWIAIFERLQRGEDVPGAEEHLLRWFDWDSIASALGGPFLELAGEIQQDLRHRST